jgi:hypothetical protein
MAVSRCVEPLHMTSLFFFAGNGKLQPELFHGLAHERGEIGRFSGRDQIGVNNHLPVLIERAWPLSVHQPPTCSRWRVAPAKDRR